MSGNGTDSPTVTAALALAAQSFSVFPCTDKKRPAIGGPGGYKHATSDPDKVRALFATAGTAAKLIGVPTGLRSGFDVLDVDPRHGGHVWRAANLHRLTETRIHRTPGLPKVPTDPVKPGEHWIYRHAEGVRNVQDGKTIAPGVDVRGEGGYAIMPPSPGYEVIHEAEIAPWPPWLLELVMRKGTAKPSPPPIVTDPSQITDKRLAGLVHSLLTRVSGAAEGAKHNTLRSIARTLGGYAHLLGQSDEQLIGLLINALPATVGDWNLARRTAAWAIAEGRKRPIELMERERRP
jgi:hypothetical protein